MSMADDSQPTVADESPAEKTSAGTSTEPIEPPSASPAPAAQAEGAGAPPPSAETAPGAAEPPEPPSESLIDAIADLLQMLVNWLRQEAAAVMRDKVVLPIQRLGLTLASAMAAAVLFVIGMGFLFVALLLVLANWLGWPGALALVGGVILIGAGVFTFVKIRSIQK